MSTDDAIDRSLDQVNDLELRAICNLDDDRDQAIRDLHAAGALTIATCKLLEAV